MIEPQVGLGRADGRGRVRLVRNQEVGPGTPFSAVAYNRRDERAEDLRRQLQASADTEAMLRRTIQSLESEQSFDRQHFGEAIRDVLDTEEVEVGQVDDLLDRFGIDGRTEEVEVSWKVEGTSTVAVGEDGLGPFAPSGTNPVRGEVDVTWVYDHTEEVSGRGCVCGQITHAHVRSHLDDEGIQYDDFEIVERDCDNCG